jgi:hypothetical protein
MSLRQNIKEALRDYKPRRTVYSYEQPEVKTLNRILNITLKKKFDWVIGINIMFIEKTNFGIQRPKLSGVLKVDQDWFGKQWTKFNYSLVPNPNQNNISIVEMPAIEGVLAIELSEIIKTGLSITFGDTIDGFQWFDLYIRTEKIEKDEVSEGEITEKCWTGYTQKGMKTMFGKRYPNCVKKTKK